ncbi:MAG: transcription-repair coupling factor [Candidatus Nanopelagicales bacterium]
MTIGHRGSRLDTLATRLQTSHRGVGPRGSWAPLIANHIDDHSLLVVTPGTRDAEQLVSELRFWAPDADIALFPAWETLPHERLTPSADIVGSRLAVVRALTQGDAPQIVVAPVRALMQQFPREVAHAAPVVLGPGGELDPAHAAARLVRFGYEHCDLVERRGQFAVRGGILDVFPPTAAHPIRAELWGDTIEELREFAVTDQRTIATLDRPVVLLPVRELLLDDDVRRRALDQAPRHPEARSELNQMAEGISVPGMEALAPLVSAGMVSLPDLMPPDYSVVVVEPDRVQVRSEETARTAAEFAAAAWAAAGVGAETPITSAVGALATWDEIAARMPDPVVVTSLRADGAADLGLAPVGPFAGSTEALTDVAQRARDGWQVAIVASGPGPADRLAEVLAEREVATSRAESLQPGVVTLAVGQIDTGFLWGEERIAVYSDRDFARRTQRRSSERTRLPSRRRRQVDPLSLTAGDFIVHEKHGVGRFIELIRRDVRGADREFLVVEYAPSKRGHPPDRLFIPTDQLGAVSRYVGGEEPKVNKLGGSDWARAKGRARKAVKEIAAELIRLYAARQAAPGFSFSPDTPWQRELEDAFEFVETADQLACIDEVKADMERPVPMDRLICGDVGYGKTEIAVRAAFKAVQDGKQVAVLVPTTLLVQQHLTTFTERFGGFPVRVAALSRFQSDKDAKKVIAGIADGSVDIVIGTHRLLTPQIRFKDLGLVIVDEEQRFGVEHKEHLKALRANVDMLAMSATPIPRTLEMAVTGIREMSTIATPPEERLPVLTYVGASDDRQIAAAIHRELLRDGQVFFVHNRVETIDRTATHLAELVPEASVAVAHGQMPEAQLEQVVLDFWEGRIDVLVCTTIVESGIDISNANTLIVDRADTFGLSQLHQLRGRVGRSRSRAYAYFMHSPEKALSETAHERLATIAQNTDLGSGMQVALKDLEIRGAGNLLGAEQSGHIADVGFDLYIRMVGEALAEYKGEKPADDSNEIRIDLPVDAHLSEEYVPEQRLRLEAYRRLAEAKDDAEIDDLAAEWADRYGPLPPEARTMIALARFRLLAQSVGLDEVITVGTRVRLHPVELPDSRRVRAARLYPGAIAKPATRQLLVPLPDVTDDDALDWATTLVNTVLVERSGGTA